MSNNNNRVQIHTKIVPQHQIENGNEELAYMLKHKYADTSVEEIYLAYSISEYRCHYCGYNTRYESFKDIFNHFRHVHYQPLDSQSIDNRNTFYNEAEKEYSSTLEKLEASVVETRKEYDLYRNTNYDDYRYYSDYQVALNKRNNYEHNQAEEIDRIITTLIDTYDRKKEKFNRAYSLLQYCVVYESYDDKPRTRKRTGKYIALYKIAKEFLFTVQQLGVLLHEKEYYIRRKLYKGLDAFYNGEKNYPTWMQHALQQAQQ